MKIRARVRVEVDKDKPRTRRVNRTEKQLVLWSELARHIGHTDEAIGGEPRELRRCSGAEDQKEAQRTRAPHSASQSPMQATDGGKPTSSAQTTDGSSSSRHTRSRAVDLLAVVGSWLWADESDFNNSHQRVYRLVARPNLGLGKASGARRKTV